MSTHNHDGENPRTCSFCGRNEHQVLFLIPAPRSTDVYICDDCVNVCADLLGEQEPVPSSDSATEEAELSYDTLPRPIEIKEMLDTYVIGQEEAKRVLAVAVYNHYKRILSKKEKKEGDDRMQKPLATEFMALTAIPT